MNAKVKFPHFFIQYPEVIFMEPAELTAFVAALAVTVSNILTEDDELALFAIALDLLGDNLDAIIAQRAIAKNKEIIPLPIRENDNLL